MVTGQTLLWDYRPAELGSEARVCGGLVWWEGCGWWLGRLGWWDGGMGNVSVGWWVVELGMLVAGHREGKLSYGI
jgi:hypothetical protein